MLTQIVTSIGAVVGEIIGLVILGFLVFALVMPGTQTTQLNYTLTFLAPEGGPAVTGEHGVWGYSRITADNQLSLENRRELKLDKNGSVQYCSSVDHAVTFLEGMILKCNLVKKPPFQLVFYDGNGTVYLATINKENTQLVTYTRTGNGGYAVCENDQARVVESKVEPVEGGWNIQLTVRE